MPIENFKLKLIHTIYTTYLCDLLILKKEKVLKLNTGKKIFLLLPFLTL